MIESYRKQIYVMDIRPFQGGLPEQCPVCLAVFDEWGVPTGLEKIGTARNFAWVPDATAEFFGRDATSAFVLADLTIRSDMDGQMYLALAQNTVLGRVGEMVVVMNDTSIEEMIAREDGERCRSASEPY